MSLKLFRLRIFDRSTEYAPSIQVLAAILGLTITLLIAPAHLLGYTAFCFGLQDCNALAVDSRAKLFGVLPISVVGLTYYASMIVLLTTKVVPIAVIRVLAIVGVIASLYFLSILHFTIGINCIYCQLSAIVSCLLNYFLHIPSVEKPKASVTFMGSVVAVFVILTYYGLYNPKKIFATHNVEALAKLALTELVDDSRLIGKSNNRIKLVVFTDLQCTACHQLIPKLKKVISSGKYQVSIRHFPLPSHPLAGRLALFAECARSNVGLIEFIEYVGKQPPTNISDVISLEQNYLKKYGHFSVATFESAKVRLERDSELVKLLGLRGTPFMILVDSDSASRTVVWERDL